tara:strand:+ start:552 stop:1763 length:1212 start_codon:yes stop_codon:yes gene_type:complete
MLKNLIHTLPAPNNKSLLVSKWQNATDIITQIKKTHVANLPYGYKLAPYFDSNNERESCRKIWNFLKYEVPYKAESADRQTTKTLPKFLADAANGQKHDCKHYAQFTGAILAALKIPFSYRFTSYSGNIPQHVYCVTKRGVIIDAVLNTFDTEKNYKTKKDMSLYAMSGTDEIGALNLKNVKKAVAKTAVVAKNVIQKTSTVSLVVPRAAFLALCEFNVFGIAKTLASAEQKAGLKAYEFWLKLGGNRSELSKVVAQGANKKIVLGAYDEAQIGFAIPAAIASSVPVVIAFKEAMTKLGVKPEDLAKLKSLAEKGADGFKTLTGKNVKDVIFKKAGGQTTSKTELEASDVKQTTQADADKVAAAIVENAAPSATDKPTGGKSNMNILYLGLGLFALGKVTKLI